MATTRGKYIFSVPNIMPETTMYHPSSGGYKDAIVAGIFAFFASCDSALGAYFLVIGIVMGNAAQTSALQSQMVKRRNGIRLWSDMWK